MPRREFPRGGGWERAPGDGVTDGCSARRVRGGATFVSCEERSGDVRRFQLFRTSHESQLARIAGHAKRLHLRYPILQSMRSVVRNHFPRQPPPWQEQKVPLSDFIFVEDDLLCGHRSLYLKLTGSFIVDGIECASNFRKRHNFIPMETAAHKHRVLSCLIGDLIRKLQIDTRLFSKLTVDLTGKKSRKFPDSNNAATMQTVIFLGSRSGTSLP